jgi:hypothetical protein
MDTFSNRPRASFQRGRSRRTFMKTFSSISAVVRRGRNLRRAVICLVFLCTGAQACAATNSAAGRDVRISATPRLQGQAVTQVELQQSIQRFTGEFIDSIASAADGVPGGDPRREQIVLRRLLLYGSSSLDIASGPQPEVNLLDMLVFITLSRQSLENYWGPQILGDQSHSLVKAFADSERRLWTLSDRIMSEAQQRELSELIRQWRTEHADQVRVEWVRFGDFASHSNVVAQERDRAARGLLGSVKSAAQSADQALMLAERGMFLVNRLPFLLRLQARLGVQETLDDSLGKLQNIPALVAAAPKLRGALVDTIQVTSNAQAAAHETRLLYEAVEPLLHSLKLIEGDGADPNRAPTVTWAQVHEVLESSNRLTDRSLALAQEVHWLAEHDSTVAAQRVEAGIVRMLRRSLVYLVVLGAAWSVFFWGGYFLAKRAIALTPGTRLSWISARMRRRSPSTSDSR